MRSLSLLRLNLSVAVPFGPNTTTRSSMTTLPCAYNVALGPITVTPSLYVPLTFPVPRCPVVVFHSIAVLHPVAVI